MCTPIVTKEVNNLALNIFPYDRGFVSCVLSDICVVFFYECYAVHIMSHWFIASKSEKKTVTKPGDGAVLYHCAYSREVHVSFPTKETEPLIFKFLHFYLRMENTIYIGSRLNCTINILTLYRGSCH